MVTGEVGRLKPFNPQPPSENAPVLQSKVTFWESGKASVRLKHSVNCFIYLCEVLSSLTSRDLQVKEWVLHDCGLHASISCMYACVCGCVCVSTCLCDCICVTILACLGMYKCAWMWFNRMHAWLEDVHMNIHTCLVTTAHVQCLSCRKGLRNCKQCKSHPPASSCIWVPPDLRREDVPFDTVFTSNKESDGCHSSVITKGQQRR